MGCPPNNRFFDFAELEHDLIRPRMEGENIPIAAPHRNAILIPAFALSNFGRTKIKGVNKAGQWTARFARGTTALTCHDRNLAL
jgi:hypothetical protein